MNDKQLYAAPMEGLTGWLWRRVHHELFGGADKYFTPFLSPNANHSFQAKERDEIEPAHNEGLPVVPQILTNSSEHFIWCARELHARGYGEVNLNLGCPSGTVTGKRKGSGLLAFPDELDRLLGEIFTALPELRISVKTRIGKLDPAEWEHLLAIYNRYPIAELIVHPRVQKEFYKGRSHRDVFAWTLGQTQLPLCESGDLFTPRLLLSSPRPGGDGRARPDRGSRPPAPHARRRARFARGTAGAPRPAFRGLSRAAERRPAGAPPHARAVELPLPLLRRRAARSQGHPQGENLHGLRPRRPRNSHELPPPRGGGGGLFLSITSGRFLVLVFFVKFL